METEEIRIINWKKEHIPVMPFWSILIELRGKREVGCISPDHVCSLASSTKTNFARREADKTSKRVRAVTFLLPSYVRDSRSSPSS